LSLAVVRDLRKARAPAGPDELAAFETDVLAGFVLARAAAGLADATIRSDVGTQLRGARLMAEVGLRVNEASHLDLADVSGTWAGSGSCTSAKARAPAGRGRASAWCR